MPSTFSFTRETRRGFLSSIICAGVSLAFSAVSWADQHTAGVPALSSRPGAEYTVYLNVAGFNYSGTWGNDPGGNVPGSTLAVNDRGPTDTFTAAEQEQIKAIWSRVSQSYVGLNVNVTTVDPAIAAGQAGTDAARQAFYDSTANLMHTVIGSGLRGATNWQGSGDGVSGLDVISGVSAGTGLNNHTNWMFTEAQAGAANGNVINGDYIGAVASHENGHAFGLSHQSDFTGSTKVQDYSAGDASPGNGSYVPIMGAASDRQRVTWRVGDTTQGGQTVVNDLARMLTVDAVSNGRTGAADLHFVNGFLGNPIGHTMPTATALSFLGDGTVNFSLATGIIVPLSEANPLAIGAGNYTQDWFQFTLADMSAISLTVHDGTQFLMAGIADGVGTLRSTLEIYNGLGALIGSGTEDGSTLFETYSSSLGAGTYFAKVGSFGGHDQVSAAFNPAQYFDTGAYFITGSGLTVVPEPGTVILFGAGLIVMCLRRKRRAAAL